MCMNQKTGFGPAECREIKEQVRVSYENGRRIAGLIPDFTYYKEHHRLENGHIEKVLHKTRQAAAPLERLFAANDYNGLYTAALDRRTLEMMALYHDTGMDGNIEFSEYQIARERYLSQVAHTAQSFERQFRKNHSIQSAIHVLRDRAFIEGKQVNADETALGCLLHSKSCSGVTNLADPREWENAIARLQAAVSAFLDTHPGSRIYFDDSFLRAADGSLSQKKLAVMRTESLCLRIGDANGHDSSSRLSQSGKPISFRIDDWGRGLTRLSPELLRQIENSDFDGIPEEVSGASVLIDGTRLDETNDPGGISRMYTLGEGNLRSLDLVTGPDSPVEIITLVRSDAYPLSTQFCIEERIREWNTAATEPNRSLPTKVMPGSAGTMSPDHTRLIQQMQNRLPKVDIKTAVFVGPASERTVKSYQSFADRIWHTYGLRVILPGIDLSDPANPIP